MSSPSHKYLFSPPPSPPTRARAIDSDPNHGLTSLKSLLLPTEFFPRASLDGSSGGGLKPRSPHTPQESKFTLDNAYPTTYPSRLKIFDPEATPVQSTPTTPLQRPEKKGVLSPPYLPSNVPSTPLPIPSSLPKPVLRLLFLTALLLSSILMLVYIPAARLPSLRAASASRRLALSPDGRAYYDLENAITSWSDARDRDYKPPQIKASRMMRRAIEEKAAPAPHPRTNRPAVIPRPLPESHELLALQSYLLASSYNSLPESVNPQQPLDANAVLGFGAHKLGPSGGDLEKEWLAELESERGDDIVVWYGGDGQTKLPHGALDVLASIHGSHRHPTLMPCHSRPDRSSLLAILDRLSLDLRHHPIIMIGNEPIVADAEGLEELRLSGRLDSMMTKIGWKEETKKNWAPKLAVVKKRELTEVEEAVRAAK